MAVLSEVDRAALAARFQSEVSAERIALAGVVRADIIAAYDAADGWCDANLTSFNSAIPQPARSALPLKVKVRILLDVIRRRFEVT